MSRGCRLRDVIPAAGKTGGDAPSTSALTVLLYGKRPRSVGLYRFGTGPTLPLLILLAGLLLSAFPAPAQPSGPQPFGSQPSRLQPAKPQSAQGAAPQQTSQPAPPPGKVLFSRSLNSATNTQTATQPAVQPAQPPGPSASSQSDSLGVTDAERNALTFTAYDLDVHLMPASAAISVRAGLTVRNDSPAPLARLVFQITSSMQWDAFSTSSLFISSSVSHASASAPSGATTPLSFGTHLVDTDADHTGEMNEAVITLPRALAPGASLALIALYSGEVQPSAERLERIGAPDDQALAADWDAIATGNSDGQPVGTALRGFGNVLWYPVSAPPVFLGDGAKLFQSVGRAKLRQSAAIVQLRLAIEYTGDAPDAAFFCGRKQPLTAISDNSGLPQAESPGIATAVFAPQPLGFRTLSLFVTGRPAAPIGPPADPALITAVTSHYGALPAYTAAATLVQPMLVDWFGQRPFGSLAVLDHPGQPFEDDALLVCLMSATKPEILAPSLAHSLTYLWIHSIHPWIDQGLAQFAGLLWIERTSGRAAALAELQDAARPLALIEPEVPVFTPIPAFNASAGGAAAQPSTLPNLSANTPADTSADSFVSPAGVSLADATGDIFYRTKAAAVWWMLRGIVGDRALKQALQTYRLDPSLDLDPDGFERTLEKSSHQDLRWFFDDWVYRDRGLPDLSIIGVTPSRIESHAGLSAGWLVAVEVHNDGYAEAEVPVTVRSATSTETRRLRIPGRSNASIRIVFSGTPQQIQVNDGSVPETQTSVHTQPVVLPAG